jgi:hypothetical protein
VKPQRTIARVCIVIGSLLALAPVFAMAAVFFTTMRSYSNALSGGAPNEQAMRSEIAQNFAWMNVSFVLCPIGIVIFAVSLIFYLRRRPLAPPPLR